MYMSYAILAVIVRYGAVTGFEIKVTSYYSLRRALTFFMLCHFKTPQRCHAVTRRMSSIPFNLASLNATLATWLHDVNPSSPPTSVVASPDIKFITDPTTASAKPSSGNFDFAFAKSVTVEAKNGPLRTHNKNLEGRCGAVFC